MVSGYFLLALLGVLSSTGYGFNSIVFSGFKASLSLTNFCLKHELGGLSVG